MTKILLSIHPQWVEKILKREKKWEIRKTVPKKPEPYRIFIYQTGNGSHAGDWYCRDGEKEKKKHE